MRLSRSQNLRGNAIDTNNGLPPPERDWLLFSVSKESLVPRTTSIMINHVAGDRYDFGNKINNAGQGR